ncbi:recombinase family protein [Alicyclobacillus curvatus]|nr:recombinase family protein [Alicyclobacillus curvatus]
MPICAIYARVSDEAQVKGESIEHQISFCREIARRRSSEGLGVWETPPQLVYVDEGISGTSLVKRAAVQQLVEDARRQRFELVLFKGISRFARDTVDALVMLRTLLASGVRVVSVEENFDSLRDNAEFVFTIHSALAQAESEKTAVRVRMGAIEKARQGKWNGKPPDGYILNKVTKHLEVDVQFAPLIREVFDLYVGGLGARKIAALLNERGVRTKRGNLWTQRTILRMLTNPAYQGDVAYGRREKRSVVPKNSHWVERRKVTTRVSDSEQIVVSPNAHAAIIDRATFERVQHVLASRREVRGRSGELHLLSRGLIRCTCGSSMIVKYNNRGDRYYRCVRQADSGRTLCSQPFLRADEVERILLLRIRSDVLQPYLIDRLSKQLSVADSAHQLHTELAHVQQQLHRVIRTSQLLFEQLAEGHISEQQFVHLNAEYRQRIEGLEKRGEELHISVDGLRDESGGGQLVKDAMRQVLSPGQAHTRVIRQFLEQLVERIDAHGKELEIRYRFKPPPSAVLLQNVEHWTTDGRSSI